MTELVITQEDSSYLPNVRRIVKSLVGVEKVCVPRKKRLSRYEQSLLDVKKVGCTKRKAWTICSISFEPFGNLLYQQPCWFYQRLNFLFSSIV